MLVSDGWHRRQAVAIASTLPEDMNDARTILLLTIELLDSFLSGASKPLKGNGDIRAFAPQSADG